jgi:hypothetical protein
VKLRLTPPRLQRRANDGAWLPRDGVDAAQRNGAMERRRHRTSAGALGNGRDPPRLYACSGILARAGQNDAALGRLFRRASRKWERRAAVAEGHLAQSLRERMARTPRSARRISEQGAALLGATPRDDIVQSIVDELRPWKNHRIREDVACEVNKTIDRLLKFLPLPEKVFDKRIYREYIKELERAAARCGAE